MTDHISADKSGVVDTIRVETKIRGALSAAKASGWTDEDLAELTGIKARMIKAYRTGERTPSIAAMLSLATVLGKGILNPLLSLVGHAARALDESDALDASLIIATVLPHVSTIATAAADGRIDHMERPGCQDAADQIIAAVLPLSSAGEAA